MCSMSDWQPAHIGVETRISVQGTKPHTTTTYLTAPRMAAFDLKKRWTGQMLMCSDSSCGSGSQKRSKAPARQDTHRAGVDEVLKGVILLKLLLCQKVVKVMQLQGHQVPCHRQPGQLELGRLEVALQMQLPSQACDLSRCAPLNALHQTGNILTL